MRRDKHVRALAASTLVNTSGDGLYIAGSALFFTRGLGFPVSEVGLALTCAGVLGLTAGVPIGRLADRHGPRDVLIVVQLVQAVAIGSYVLVGRSLPAFVTVATVVIAGMQGADAAKGALAGSLRGGDPVRLRSLLQSVSNIGISAGTVFAGFLIAGGTHHDYELLMLADAASFLVAAALLLSLPRVSSHGTATPVARSRRWLALKDRRYLALTSANGVMSLQYFVLAFAMPLWVIGHTSAPRWLISPMLLTNTVMIVVLQVRFSRGSKTPAGAAKSVRRAGVVLAASMVLYSVAAGNVEAIAVPLLVMAVITHSFGELLQNSGAFGISYGLASQDALGEYLGVYGLGIGICRACAPGILAATCLEHGMVGWAALAVLFAASGLATPTLVGRAQANRTPVAVPSVEGPPEVELALASTSPVHASQP